MSLKKWLLLVFALLLTGCGTSQTFETVSDEIVQSVMAQPREISVRLPDNAIAPVLESDTEQVYLSEEYEILLQTLSAGDLDATIRTLSGYGRDQVTVIQTKQEDVVRSEFVWVSAGEQGSRLGRAVILDDGHHHYCLSVLRDAQEQKMSQVVWSDVFASFQLV